MANLSCITGNHKLFMFDQSEFCLACMENLIGKKDAEIAWAKGQFQGIRNYTTDGKVAAACADAESRLEQSLRSE